MSQQWALLCTPPQPTPPPPQKKSNDGGFIFFEWRQVPNIFFPAGKSILLEMFRVETQKQSLWSIYFSTEYYKHRENGPLKYFF